MTDSRCEVWGVGCGHGAYAPLRYEVFAVGAVSVIEAVSAVGAVSVIEAVSAIGTVSARDAV